jgi:predicted flap endonuclease-1-like 5' DNA nuclease
MSPFVQELVSFISILAGVVVLTSWVMWVLFRPSGDSKVKDFAQESAKDGLTRCVIENNELKNTVKRLERENKVLMSAGYGKTVEERGKVKEEETEQVKEEKSEEERGKVKGERVETKDEGLEIKDEGLKIENEGVQIEEMAGLLDVDSIETEPVVEEALDEELEPTVHKITDEAEKKKIVDYMANVEKTTERQKEEIKKIESWKESGPHSDDNLKMIRGIGPHIEKMLKKAGITSYKQIASFNEEDIRLVSDAIGSFPRRISRELWVEQAKGLVRGRR